jgi:hypothetical protein
VTLIGLLCVVTAWADTLTDQNATHYGKLVRITQSEILFDENCSADQRVEISLANFVAIEFDTNCERPENAIVASPRTLPCPGQEETLFTISFKETGITKARAVETVEDSKLKITPIKTNDYLIGPIQDVRSILHGPVCLEIIDQPQWPSSFQQSFNKKVEPKTKEKIIK